MNEDRFSLEKFSERTYSTMVARARASERLALRGTVWSIALATSSAATLAVSMAAIAHRDLWSGKADLWACLSSMLTLVLSLVVSSLNYGARSRDLFHSYRAIQRISSKAEIMSAQTAGEASTLPDWQSLNADYQAALDYSENHSTTDYVRGRLSNRHLDTDQAKTLRKQSRAQRASGWLLTALPVCLTFASLALITVVALTA